MRVLVVTPPDPVVSLAEAKDHLRVTSGRDDAVITGFVAAATGHIDGPGGWLGRAIGIQTLEAALPTWCVAEDLALPCPPVVRVLSITYRDAQRQTITVPADRYEMFDGFVEPIGEVAWSAALPAKNGIRVRYEAGYETLPSAIRAAILLMTGDLYANRETTTSGVSGGASAIPMATTVQALLGPYRVFT